MRKELIHLALFVFILSSCEEYYKPAMDVVPSILVVDAHLSNDSQNSFVKLTMTNDFYNTAQAKLVTGANVKLIEEGNHLIEGYEQTMGFFIFADTLVPGKKYRIRITYK